MLLDVREGRMERRGVADYAKGSLNAPGKFWRPDAAIGWGPLNLVRNVTFPSIFLLRLPPGTNSILSVWERCIIKSKRTCMGTFQCVIFDPANRICLLHVSLSVA